MFKSARIKLTAWYLFIIMLVSVSFSVGVYKILTHEFERFARIQRYRIEHGVNPPFDRPLVSPPSFNNPDPELVNETKTRIATNLVLVNVAILVVSGLSGYFLAGKTLKPIKDMVDEQNRFITDASHEFRTPLTALKSSMEVFLRDPKVNIFDAKTLIKDSIGDVDCLNMLSDSLLQLAQYQKPNGIIKFEVLSLAEIIKDAVNRVKPIAKQKKIITNNDAPDFKVEGNKYSLSDLFVILLENAIKYSKVNGVISIKAKVADKYIQVSVSDKGVGISEKDLPHVFDRFYRADASRAQFNNAGYGLGLSIAKSIVETHHGSIRAESILNKGTTIVINLPTVFS